MPPEAPENSRRTRLPGARRIGLFGGSFDPVHEGHLHAAREARRAFRLDRVVFVPAAQPPHKPGRQLARGRDRLAMLELALEGESGFSVHSLELERGGTSYTIDTVRALPAAIGEPLDAQIFLILGSDNLPGLATWRDARALIDRVQPIVVHRAGDPVRLLDEVREILGEDPARKVKAGYLRLPPVVISSSAVRESLPALGKTIEGLAPSVRDYIRAHRLYGVQP